MKSVMTMTSKNLRIRKFLLIAPVLVLPFIILLLWTFGVVGSGKAIKQRPSSLQGVNLSLPSAAPAKDSNWNKLKYYEQAEKDSQKLKMQLKKDPFLKGLEEEDYANIKGITESQYAENLYGGENQIQASADRNEQQVYERLRKLQHELDRERQAPDYKQPDPTPSQIQEIKQLESAMQQMQSSGKDPELGQLDQMLDKIIAIQNPEKVQEQVRQASEKRKGQVFGVKPKNKTLLVSTLQPLSAIEDTSRQKGFFPTSDASDNQKQQGAVNAVVHQTQTIVNGATVKLRLTDDIYVNGILIPKESFVYGEASLNGERLKVLIKGIRYQSHLLPVALSVYDLDGLEGIRVPGAISREVMQQSTDRGLQGLGFTTVSPSVGLQAAGMGVEAVKSFLSKKVKLVRVTLKAGYQVLLKDEKRKD